MIKLLAIGDAGWPTGFQRVMTKLLGHLDTTGDFDITVQGSGYTADAPIQYPWPVYPITTKNEDIYGLEQLPDYIALHKPDALLFVNDIWNVQQYLLHKPPTLRTIAYTPVDCPVVKWSYALATGGLSATIAYTPFGQREIVAGVQDGIDIMLEGQQLYGHDPEARRSWLSLPKNDTMLHLRLDRLARAQNRSGIDILPHGRAEAHFQPMDKKDARAAYGLPDDAFIVTNVNACQFRKRQDLTLRAWKAFMDRVKPARGTAFLVFHSAGGTRTLGWDLAQLIRLYGLTDSVVCVDQHKPELTEEELVMLYNTADVNINTGGGEGWGLTIHESAACGVAQVVPDWSVTRAHWTDAGVLLPVSTWRHEVKMLNTAHCEIDVTAAADILRRMYLDREWTTTVGQACRVRSQQFDTWETILPHFERIVRRALEEPEHATPLSFSEVRAQREAAVTSALREEAGF